MDVRSVCLGLALLMSASLNAWGANYSIVCEVVPGTDIDKVAKAFHGKVIDRVFDHTYVIAVAHVPNGAAPPGVLDCEMDGRAAMPVFQGGVVSITGVVPAEWYRTQPALTRVSSGDALTVSKGRGIIIADINSAVDYSHPALRGVLTSGRDFVAEKSRKSPDDRTNLNQATASFLDQATASFLDQATASFLDQATASFLDQATASFLDTHNPAHGHGTMVAGILAAVAPESMVMPLRVFDDQGEASISDIAKAIEYAVKNGAHVINMSFGTFEDRRFLKKAILLAQRHNVTLVASAGNNNIWNPQYPAGYDGVIAVAATDLNDKKAYFSNYGETIDVAAPGVNIVSSYPSGLYAVLSGTSFSAPIVAGEAALLLSQKRVLTGMPIERSSVNIDAINSPYKLGFGRVNLHKALELHK